MHYSKYVSPQFVHQSIVSAPADELFAWHERPDALEALMPFGVRLEHRSGGLRDGGRVTLSMGVGPLRAFWEARHYGYVPGVQFCDEQVYGPFRAWRHVHRIEPAGDGQSLYEDRVEYELPGGRWLQPFLDPLFRRLLAPAFARRHRVVQALFPKTPSDGGAAGAARHRR